MSMVLTGEHADNKIQGWHRDRLAVVYVRQSSRQQLAEPENRLVARQLERAWETALAGRDPRPGPRHPGAVGRRPPPSPTASGCCGQSSSSCRSAPTVEIRQPGMPAEDCCAVWFARAGETGPAAPLPSCPIILRMDSLSLTCGKSSGGTSAPRKAHSGSHPCLMS